LTQIIYKEDMKANLTIETIGAQGDGIARHNGKIIYIERALPGETITADIQEDRDGISRGRLIQVVDASSDRREAPCRHYPICGGCHVQHMTESAYHQWKIAKVQALFMAKGISPAQWNTPVFIPAGTRRRATFSVYRQKEQLIIGYHKRRSPHVIDLDECLLLDHDILPLVQKLRSFLTDMVVDRQFYDLFIQKCDNGFDMVLTGVRRNKKTYDLAFLEAAAAIIRETRILRIGVRAREHDAVEIIVESGKPLVTMGALRVPVPPHAFLQPSVTGQAVLSETAIDYLGDSVQGKVADLFAGCGTFTGAVIDAGGQCDAYESEIAAVNAVKQSGHRGVFTQNLFTNPLTKPQLKQYDAVIIDPPRAGSKAQSEIMALSNVPKIVSISCNPVTFARDAKILTDGETYRLERLKIVDQFIWSPHVELIGLFVRS